VWHPPVGARDGAIPAPGPTVGIVSANGKAQGYWIFGATGRVVSRGAAPGFGGDNNLALATQ
jgi:hypothetical protein